MFILAEFWRLKVLNKVSQRLVLREELSHASLLVSDDCGQALVFLRSYMPILPLPLCLHISFFSVSRKASSPLIKTPLIGFRTQTKFRLRSLTNYIYKFPERSHPEALSGQEFLGDNIQSTTIA